MVKIHHTRTLSTFYLQGLVIMKNPILTNNFVIDLDTINKQELTMNLVTDGFRFVASENQWPEPHTERIFEQLDEIGECLTDDECNDFVIGLQETIHDSSLLYKHVTGFTRKMLYKWGVYAHQRNDATIN